MTKIKASIINWCLKDLFNALTGDCFLSVKSTTSVSGKRIHSIFVGESLLPENEANILGSEARTVLKLSIYKRLMESMRTEATRNLVNKSTSVDDMVFSKAMLYTLDILEKKLKDISVIQ